MEGRPAEAKLASHGLTHEYRTLLFGGIDLEQADGEEGKALAPWSSRVPFRHFRLPSTSRLNQRANQMMHPFNTLDSAWRLCAPSPV